MILKWHQFRACGLINNKISFRETWMGCVCEGVRRTQYTQPQAHRKEIRNTDESNKWNSCRVRLAVWHRNNVTSHSKSFIFEKTSFDTATFRLHLNVFDSSVTRTNMRMNSPLASNKDSAPFSLYRRQILIHIFLVFAFQQHHFGRNPAAPLNQWKQQSLKTMNWLIDSSNTQ